MKNMIRKYTTIIVFMLISCSIYCQDTISQYQGSIIAGTNKWFIIKLKQEMPVKAKILSIVDNGIFIKEKDGTTRTIDRSIISHIEAIPYGSIGTFGVGFGVPYALLGFNVEMNLLPYLSLTGGIGTTLVAGIGYNVGAKVYFRKPGPVWRPRLSIYYGINGVYAEDVNDPDNEKYPGITAGIGQLFLWDRHGFDLDLMYIVDSEVFDEHDAPGRVKISFGYRYAF